MLGQGQKIALTILVAIFSGFAVVGMFVMAVTAYSLVVGELDYVWYPLMFFLAGGVGGIVALRSAMKKVNKDVTKRLNLD